MYWKLRIPLFLFLMGVLSGLKQNFSSFLLVNTSGFIRNVVFFTLIGSIFAILENTRVNETEVHFTIGIGIILLGFLFDYLTVQL